MASPGRRAMERCVGIDFTICAASNSRGNYRVDTSGQNVNGPSVHVRLQLGIAPGMSIEMMPT